MLNEFGLSSDHVKNACDELYIHIAILLSSLVVHGCLITDDLALSTVPLIPKVETQIISIPQITDVSLPASF